MDLHEEAVKRGDKLVEQVALHEAAVAQLRATIAQQRADREVLMEERQAARTRCVELESQLHALTADARHLAEGLQRVQAEREAERRLREEPVAEVTAPPRLRLAGTGDTA
jgi:chromosome segregation ATPase